MLTLISFVGCYRSFELKYPLCFLLQGLGPLNQCKMITWLIHLKGIIVQRLEQLKEKV